MTIRNAMAVLSLTALLAACGGGGTSGGNDDNGSGGDDGGGGATSFTVTVDVGSGGSASTTSVTVEEGNTANITVTADSGFEVDAVTGCSGTLSGSTYTTGAISGNCTVSVTFSAVTPPTFTVTATAEQGGAITPSSSDVNEGETLALTVTPDSGFSIDSVSGCNGSLSGNTYTTGSITEDCSVTATFVEDSNPPVTAATLALNLEETKVFAFSWSDVNDATFYRLLENPDGNSGFEQVGQDIAQGVQSFDHIVPLYARVNASYILQSCNEDGCIDSSVVAVSGTLVEAVGRFVADDSAGNRDYQFGHALSLSQDGETLAIGVPNDDSTVIDSGAVYVFVSDGLGQWTRQAYLKAGVPFSFDEFGSSIALSSDGNRLLVGAPRNNSEATGINGDESGSLSPLSGAAYIFERDGEAWSQTTFIKAGQAINSLQFGSSVTISGDGNTAAIGALDSVYLFADNSGWSQIDTVEPSQQAVLVSDFGKDALSLSNDGTVLAVGDSSDSNRPDNGDTSLFFEDSGAVYIFSRTGDSWFETAFLKASNAEQSDFFGESLSLSGDGATLAVGAFGEDSLATGIDGEQVSMEDETFGDIGAVYVFEFADNAWSQTTYIKAATVEFRDRFGAAVSLSDDGNTLAVGASQETSDGAGVNDEDNNTGLALGAGYVFVREAGGQWMQQAYLKAKDALATGRLGESITISGDASAIAIGAPFEDGALTNVDEGAVYVY